MSAEKSRERIAVESAVERSYSPLSVEQIAAKTGLHADTVRSHLNNCLNNRLVRNVNPGEKPAKYAPIREVERQGNIPEPRTCLTLGQYMPPKGSPVRDGSLDFLDQPTVINGIAHPRARPFSLSSSASTNLNARPL